MPATFDEDLLLTEVACSLPFGAWAEIGRKISFSYYSSYHMVNDDQQVGEPDKKILRGHLRRATVNEALREACRQFNIPFGDVSVGEGTDNHVEVYAGRLLVTCHRLTGSKSLPDSARYLDQNSELNLSLSQGELFDLWTVEPLQMAENPINLLILHAESDDSPSEVGDIEVVFPKGRSRLCTFHLKDVVSKQSELERLEPDDLEELKRRVEEITRKRRLA